MNSCYSQESCFQPGIWDFRHQSVRVSDKPMLEIIVHLTCFEIILQHERTGAKGRWVSKSGHLGGELLDV